jgi:simple sugar transport system ATP-binding protein
VKGRWPFRRMDMNKASEMAISELRKLGIRRVTDGRRLVGSLSGGERQALAIGRAIHFGARVLVLDEPTAALGVRESASVLRLIKAARAHGVAVLFITHNAYHAMETGDRFVVLHHGEALATFNQGEMGIEELLSLMAGGEELRELMAAEDGPDGPGARAGMP